MLRYSEEFYSQRFSGKNMKDAYLKAAKWYASNVLAKSDKMKDVMAEYEKDTSTNTVIIRLFASLTEDALRVEHCRICKESHSSIFSHSETNCAWCAIKGYQNRADKKLEIKKSYLKSILKGV